MTPTDEQKEILETAKNMQFGDILIVNALAGCAKTTTLKMIAEENLNSKFLYLAFNRKIVDESREKFPKNTKLSTLHSFARGYFGRKDLKTLNIDLVADILNIEIKGSKKNFFTVFNAFKVYEKFANSFYYLDEIPKLKAEIEKELRDEYEENQKIKNADWLIEQRLKGADSIEDIHNYIKYSDFTTFETFLKEFVEKSQNQNFNYEYIVLDESQDISKLLAKFILSLTISKKYKVITVGDTSQKIYGFLGNIDITRVLKSHNKRNLIIKNLTQTFRFKKNSEIEYLSNLILNIRHEHIKGSELDLPKVPKSAFISRSTFPLLAMAIYQIQEKKEKYHLYGRTDNFNRDEIEDIYNLYLFQTKEVFKFPNIKSKSIQAFDSFNDLLFFVSERHISEIENNISIAMFIYEQNKQLKITQNVVRNFFDLIDENSTPDSAVVISTIHKSKGLEFDNVTILKSMSMLYDEVKDKWISYQTNNGRIIGFEKVDLDLSREDSKNLSKILENSLQDDIDDLEQLDSLNFSRPKELEDVKYELNLSMKDWQIREEYNILYVGITRAIQKLSISNVHYLESLKFLDFLNRNAEELNKIFRNEESDLLVEITLEQNNKIEHIFGIIFEDSFIQVEKLQEFLDYIS